MWLTRFFLVSLALITVSGFSAPVLASPSAEEYGTVLNLSGKQRMLSQKMSKEMVLIALGVDTDNNVAQLKASAALFDRTLKGLRAGDAELGLPPTDSRRILRQLDEVDALWAEFFPLTQAVAAAGSVTDDQLAQIATLNGPLLKQMNKAVGLYEKDAQKNGLEANPALATSLNLAGKQRMLSQKMSKEYFLIAKGYQMEDNKFKLLETFSLFDRTLKGLKQGDDILGLPGTTNADVLAQLEVVEGIWQTFQPLVAEAADPSIQDIPEGKVRNVAELNLPLLKEMNKAVGMLEGLTAL